MVGFKAEPGMSTRCRTMPVRASTPISIEADVRADTQASSSSTDATFPGTDSEMVDAASTAGTNCPDPLVAFSSKGRELITKMQELQYLGIDTTLPSLPKVVCIGDQSAGKSSIIEAMSDITLPRSEGTCTRCPFHITTHSTEGGDTQWRCTISLQYTYSYLPGQTAADTTALDDWKKFGEVQVCDFTTIISKTELELNLRRAQLAILNPDKNWRHYVSLDASEVEKSAFQVDFSPNVICLEITAPKLLEMSFYDLPGAINVMHDELQDYLSDFVEKLLKQYIDDDQALIVIACPANQDFHNGIAFKYLRRCKAAGRAIGVLTKPDLVDLTPDRIGAFEKMFEGKDFWVQGGWFMTKQLSQTQLNGPSRPSYEQARSQEASFFTQHPWSSRLAKHKHRFGIVNLQEAISRKHIQHILGSLPEIIDRVQNRLAEVRQQLEGYPSKAINPGLEIIYDIDKVVKAIVAHCSPDSKDNPFRGSQRINLRQLKKQLALAAPKVEFSTPGYVKPAIAISDTDEEMVQTPSKRARGDDGRAYSVTPRGPTPGASVRTPASCNPKRKAAQPATSPSSGVSSITFRLDEVKKRFDLAPSARLPDDADFRITHDMAKESLCGFSILTQQTLDKFESSVVRMLGNCLAESLATRQGTLLSEEVSAIMRTMFDELFEKDKDIIHHNIGCLVHRPITYCKEWDAKRDEVYQKLRQGRTEARVMERYEQMEAEGFKVPTAEEERKKKVNDPAFVAGCRSPTFERELKELAMPLTFYELASSQLVDNVARNLDYLIYQIEDLVKRRLTEGLRPHDPERSATLLAEDPKREEMRSVLEGERKKLEQALEKVQRLLSTGGSD